MNLHTSITENYSTLSSADIETLKCGKKTVGLQKILDCLHQYFYEHTTTGFNKTPFDIADLSKNHDLAFPLVTAIIDDITKEDIEHSCFFLHEYTKEANFPMTGFFLSALINEHAKKTKNTEHYRLILNHLPETLDGLGCKNNTYLHVQGNLGHWSCHSMRGGSFFLDGNTDDYFGKQMQGGLAIIHGNAEDNCGIEMKNGKMIIDGTTKNDLGRYMKNGRIYCHGAGKNAGKDMEGGSIRIQGDLIYPFADYMHDGEIKIYNKHITKKELRKNIDLQYVSGNIFLNDEKIMNGRRYFFYRFTEFDRFFAY